MTSKQRIIPEFLWTGGAYPEREGIRVRATKDGLEIEPWYDGGILLECGFVLLSWERVEALRVASIQDWSPDLAGPPKRSGGGSTGNEEWTGDQ